MDLSSRPVLCSSSGTRSDPGASNLLTATRDTGHLRHRVLGPTRQSGGEKGSDGRSGNGLPGTRPANLRCQHQFVTANLSGDFGYTSPAACGPSLTERSCGRGAGHTREGWTRTDQSALNRGQRPWGAMRDSGPVSRRCGPSRVCDLATGSPTARRLGRLLQREQADGQAWSSESSDSLGLSR
jgi:hypothetical protein